MASLARAASSPTACEAQLHALLSGPSRGGEAPLACSIGNRFCTAFLYGRTERLTALFGGFRLGQRPQHAARVWHVLLDNRCSPKSLSGYLHTLSWRVWQHEVCVFALPQSGKLRNRYRAGSKSSICKHIFVRLTSVYMVQVSVFSASCGGLMPGRPIAYSIFVV